MARLTRHDAAAKAAELQAALRRLDALLDAKPKAPSVRIYDEQVRQVLSGTRHELELVKRLVTELADGLQATHVYPEVSGTRDTSAAALAAVLPKASGQRARVLNVFDRQRRLRIDGPESGATDVQLVNVTNLPPNSVRPRRGELVAQGWLEDSGDRREHRGHDHIVWRLTEAGRLRLQNGDTET